MTVETRICATPEETARSLEIYNAVFPRRAVSAERAAFFERSSVAFVNVLASLDGEDVGSAFASIKASQPDDCFVLLGVLPERRARGAGTALYDAVSRWGAEHGLGVIETRAEGDDDESLAFAKRRGFVEAWRETGFELDPRSVSPDVTPPAGVEIVHLESRPDLAAAIYGVVLEAMPDSPGQEDWQPPGLEHFLERNVNSPGTIIVLALGGEDVVGYAALAVQDDEAVHAMTAVKRAWRGRGVARALKVAQIAWAKEYGLTRLKATNEERNAPMIGINESLGYRAAPGRVGLRGPLAGTATSR